jgi:hypothetical protein
MKKPAEPSTPSGPPIREKKATDHELRKHDKFTRYGQFVAPSVRCAFGFPRTFS